MILYSDTEAKAFSGAVNADPTKAYLKHYDNYLFLQFISKNSPDPKERGQALRELTICERKMKYWARTADKTQMLAGIQECKRKWL
jgi:hypothetical protein